MTEPFPGMRKALRLRAETRVGAAGCASAPNKDLADAVAAPMGLD